MQISLVDIGVKMRANLDVENNHEAKALISAVKRGDIDGMSFMFRVDEEKMGKFRQRITFKENNQNQKGF